MKRRSKMVGGYVLRGTTAVYVADLNVRTR